MTHPGIQGGGVGGAAIAHEGGAGQEAQGGCHAQDGMQGHGGHLAVHKDDAAPALGSAGDLLAAL